MLDNLIFSVNAVVPMFLMIFLGWFFRKKNLLTDEFVSVANSFVFKIALPIKLFLDMYSCNISQTLDWKFIIYSMGFSLASFCIVWLLSVIFIKEKSKIGSFVQGCYRGNYALIGVAVIQNVMNGIAPKASLIVAFVIPLYNIMAVIILTLYAQGENGSQKGAVKKAAVNICKNPLIIGIVTGLICSLAGIKFPEAIEKVLNMFAELSTPLALIAIGGAFEPGKLKSTAGLAVTAAVIKLIVQPVTALSLAALIGFRGDDLLILFIMAGAPTAVSSYTMARAMKNDSYLASSILVISTLFSVLSFTLGVYILRSLGQI